MAFRQRRSRIRQRIDVRRLAQAIAAPGVDSRVWLEKARVDTDRDAVRWDDSLGWIADVTMQGGGVDQEGPIPCRVSTLFSGNAKGATQPVTPGQLVLVLLPEGRLDVQPTIVGALFTPDLPVPSTVNGQTIDEDFAKANHILVTEHSVQQEVGEKWRTSATSRATLAAPEVRLASEDAAQSFIKGDARKSADDSFLTALQTWAGLVREGIVAGGGTLDNTAFLAAIQQYTSDIANALSSKIKGE